MLAGRAVPQLAPAGGQSYHILFLLVPWLLHPMIPLINGGEHPAKTAPPPGGELMLSLRHRRVIAPAHTCLSALGWLTTAGLLATPWFSVSPLLQCFATCLPSTCRISITLSTLLTLNGVGNVM